MKFSNTSIFVALSTLIIILILVHAPGLGLSFTASGLEREHDFWGGLLVEVIGVTIELSLIILVLTRIQEQRWKPIRDFIKYQLKDHFNETMSEAEKFVRDIRQISEDPGRDDFDWAHFEDKFVEVESNARERYYKLSDMLQSTNNALTSEMTLAITEHMSIYRVYCDAYRHSGHGFQRHVCDPVDQGGANALRTYVQQFNGYRYSLFREMENALEKMSYPPEDSLIDRVEQFRDRA